MILVLGSSGMLGRRILERWDHRACGLTRRQVDITEAVAVHRVLRDMKPNIVINCAAFTSVDKCEAMDLNELTANSRGPEIVASACAEINSRLIHISTDYVFSGDANRANREDDATEPRTAYGRSKLIGEQAVQRIAHNSVVLRTSWLYGPQGPSFLHSMLRILADPSLPPAPIVNDQIGNPTSTDVIVSAIDTIIRSDFRGIIHASCEGETSWFGFAERIRTQYSLPRNIRPCSSAEFPRPAQRPINSRLDKTRWRSLGFSPLPHWHDALADHQRLHRTR